MNVLETCLIQLRSSLLSLTSDFSIDLTEVHDSHNTPYDPYGQKKHLCVSTCAKYYPLQTCSNVCGVCVLICGVLAAYDYPSFTYSVACDSLYDSKLAYLREITSYTDFLRLILIKWFMLGKVDFKDISHTGDLANPVGIEPSLSKLQEEVDTILQKSASVTFSKVCTREDDLKKLETIKTSYCLSTLFGYKWRRINTKGYNKKKATSSKRKLGDNMIEYVCENDGCEGKFWVSSKIMKVGFPEPIRAFKYLRSHTCKKISYASGVLPDPQSFTLYLSKAKNQHFTIR